MIRDERQCQSCKRGFTVEAEDFDFYKKVSVPVPTFCPECRMIRRMICRNLRKVYKRKCVGSETEVFSGFAPDSPFTVYEQNYWWSDAWDPMVYGREYDFSRSFFEQFREMQLQIPWPSGYNRQSENSMYCNNVYKIRDCYFVFNTGFSTECAYGTDVIESHKCFDALKIFKCEIGYELFDCENCSRVFYSSRLRECMDVYFSSGLIDCHECFGCVNLKHKRYCFFNEQLSKEAYQKRVAEYDLGSYAVLEKLWEEMRERRLHFPCRYMQGVSNVNSTGDYLDNCKNVRNSFFCRNMDSVSHSQFLLFKETKDSSDLCTAGGEMCYELEEGGGYHCKFCWLLAGTGDEMTTSYNAEYSMNCFDSSNLFGCIGLKKKQYCIFNKAYSESEYHALREKIIAQMKVVPYVDERGRVYSYGEFFPPHFSPFAYNESLAQDCFPLEREEAISKGYVWRDAAMLQRQASLDSFRIPDHIRATDDSILREVIQCASPLGVRDVHQCFGVFQITPRELEFFRRVNLPLPRKCFNCRHGERLRLRNLFRLWKRKCGCGQTKDVKLETKNTYQNTVEHFHGEESCPNEFQTTFEPNRAEIVYCEQCYQAEIV